MYCPPVDRAILLIRYLNLIFIGGTNEIKRPMKITKPLTPSWSATNSVLKLSPPQWSDWFVGTFGFLLVHLPQWATYTTPMAQFQQASHLETWGKQRKRRGISPSRGASYVIGSGDSSFWMAWHCITLWAQGSVVIPLQSLSLSLAYTVGGWVESPNKAWSSLFAEHGAPRGSTVAWCLCDSQQLQPVPLFLWSKACLCHRHTPAPLFRWSRQWVRIQ